MDLSCLKTASPLDGELDGVYLGMGRGWGVRP